MTTRPATHDNGPAGAGKRSRPCRGQDWQDDAEVYAEIEKTRFLAELARDVLTSPNTARAVDSLLSARGAAARQESRARIAIARAQLRAAAGSNLTFLAALVISLAFMGIVIWALRSDRETLLPVLTAVVGLLAGTGGGYVFGRRSVTGRGGD